jgi:hypothetical protein
MLPNSLLVSEWTSNPVERDDQGSHGTPWPHGAMMFDEELLRRRRPSRSVRGGRRSLGWG